MKTVLLHVLLDNILNVLLEGIRPRLSSFLAFCRLYVVVKHCN